MTHVIWAELKPSTCRSLFGLDCIWACISKVKPNKEHMDNLVIVRHFALTHLLRFWFLTYIFIVYVGNFYSDEVWFRIGGVISWLSCFLAHDKVLLIRLPFYEFISFLPKKPLDILLSWPSTIQRFRYPNFGPTRANINPSKRSNSMAEHRW